MPDAELQEREAPCWVCDSLETSLFRESSLAVPSLRAADFRITDSNYGTTWRLVRCASCGFIQASNTQDPLSFYEGLEDPGYEATRAQRAIQARKILDSLGPAPHGARLLDVGAGSGILVEQARTQGYDAEGVDPSEWLVAQAVARGLPVWQGILPHPKIRAGYDVACLVDVVEHVTDPVRLLREVGRVLKPGGRIVVVTPDVSSLPARILGRRWWHFRIAHVAYFDANCLGLALRRAGFEKEVTRRPSWYFPLDYLWQRTARYITLLSGVELPAWARSITVPVNLRDSIATTARLTRQ